MSRKQLRGTVRARGEEAVDELQHRTQVKPREAGLMEASVLANATPDIQETNEVRENRTIEQQWEGKFRPAEILSHYCPNKRAFSGQPKQISIVF